jgi:hypothetical protein
MLVGFAASSRTLRHALLFIYKPVAHNITRPLKSFYCIIILLFFSSCENKFETPELNKNFTVNEITDLEKLVSFFKIKVCESRSTDFKDCFEIFAPNWIENGLEYSAEKIEFSEQNAAYNNINQQTLDEIWDFCMTYQIRPTKREYLDVCANTNGKYVKFLKDFGKSNPLVQKYYEDIIAAGDFDQTGLTISYIWNKRKEIDLNNPNYQVLIALHILTMNDQYQRNQNEPAE